MRPIVKAVGLICILAHDYLIVKIKMLFRYPVTGKDNQVPYTLLLRFYYTYNMFLQQAFFLRN